MGCSVPVKYLSVFSILNNIEQTYYFGGHLSRAAGTSAILTSKNNKKISLKLKSGWSLTVSENNICSIGIMSNSQHRFKILSKAGISRGLGIRPTVRGVAMNPCDHPHGGGEGKKSPPTAARSPWGWLTKGTPSKVKKYQRLYKARFKI